MALGLQTINQKLNAYNRGGLFGRLDEQLRAASSKEDAIKVTEYTSVKASLAAIRAQLVLIEAGLDAAIAAHGG